MKSVEQHVLDTADKCPAHSYVADHGTEIEDGFEQVTLAGHQITVSEDLTDDEYALVEKAITLTQPRNKQCFTNSLNLWQYNHRFKYTEGYAAISRPFDLVIEHAWSMLDGEKIIDFTPDFESYYGVIITSEEVMAQNTGTETSPGGIICRRENRDFLQDRGYFRH